MLFLQTKKNWHWLIILVLYHLVLGVVAWLNFPEQGHFLTGWDSLHPEFNLNLNWQRSLFPVWQENYGVGTLVGHGFGSLLPHTAIVWFLSLLLPIWSLRPFFVLFTFYLGGLGMLFLTQSILGRLFGEKSPLIPWVCIIASIFYLFNLGTVQQFHLPLEAFVVQFALFPWFFWTLDRYWYKPTLPNLFLFAIANFFGSIQGFIPVLFVALTMVFGLWQATTSIYSRSWESLKKSFALISIFFLVNIYWLIPFGYYVVGNNGDFLQAYNNQVSTPEFTAKSEAFGTLQDVIFLKSFFLDGEQPLGKVFDPWLEHINSGWYQTSGWTIFFIIFLGWAYLLFQKKDRAFIAYAFSGLLVFGFLATQVPPFSWYMNFLYQNSDLFEQVFRTSFTKFGLLLAGFYSVFLAIGLAFFTAWLKKWLSNILLSLTMVMVFGLILFVGWPIFQGNLFNLQLKVPIPESYFKVTDFFKSAGEGRIAELPIECHEGWYSRDWGYYGSGFMWFGVEQPFLSRTFDVWSRYNENFYFEARYALRQPQYAGFDKVLEKYGVRWLYIDENLTHCKSSIGLQHFGNLETYLRGDSRFKLVGEFPDAKLGRPLAIYEFSSKSQGTLGAPSSYVTAAEATDQNYDVTYRNYGNYIESLDDPTVDYLFKSDSFEIGKDTIKSHATTLNPGILKIPAYQDLEEYLPFEVILSETEEENVFMGRIEFLGPNIQINSDPVLVSPIIAFGPVRITDLSNLQLLTDNISMKKITESKFIGTYFVGSENNIVALSEGEQLIWWNSSNVNVLSDYLAQAVDTSVSKGALIEVTTPKVFDQGIYGNVISALDFPPPQDCSGKGKIGETRYELSTNDEAPMLRLINQHSASCVRVPFENVDPSRGYLISIKSKYKEGLPLWYELTNWRDIRYFGNYMDTGNDSASLTFLAPQVFEQDLDYTLELSNRSFGNKQSINDLYSAEIWYLPYRYILATHVISNSGVVESGGEESAANLSNESIFQTNKLIVYEQERTNTYKYETSVIGGGLLALNQGYDQGWVARIDGKFLPHLKYNNWANAWLVPDGEHQVVIIYWPQLLSFLGYGLLGATFVGFGVTFLKKKPKKQ